MDVNISNACIVDNEANLPKTVYVLGLLAAKPGQKNALVLLCSYVSHVLPTGQVGNDFIRLHDFFNT